MRIQCKGCGKEYKVDESRLTPEGVRVKCRTCGAVLLLRIREEAKVPLGMESPPAAPPTAVSPEAESEVQADFHEMPVFEPEPKLEPEPEPALWPEPKPEIKAPLEASPPVYRFCIQCGGELERSVPAGKLPVCRNCSAPAKGKARTVSPPSALKRFLFFIFIVIVILVAAFMGYRFAKGHVPGFSLTMDDYEEHVVSPEQNQGLPGVVEL